MLALNAPTHQIRVHLTVADSGAESCGVVSEDIAPGYYPPAEGSGDAPHVVVFIRSDRAITPARIRAAYAATFLAPCPI